MNQNLYIIINKFKHNKSCFTQGLNIYNNKLYESCGLYNKSSLNKINLENNSLEKSIKIKNIFAEGITILYNIIFLLSYKSNEIYIYDINFNFIMKCKIYTTTNECWGITHNSESLIVSDGSYYLHFYEFPNKYTKILKFKYKIPIYIDGKPINNINELELVENYIYANIFTSSNIIKINTTNYKIEKIYNFSKLSKTEGYNNFMNGITFNKLKKTFLLTGKNWNYVYEVKFL